MYIRPGPHRNNICVEQAPDFLIVRPSPHRIICVEQAPGDKVISYLLRAVAAPPSETRMSRRGSLYATLDPVLISPPTKTRMSCPGVPCPISGACARCTTSGLDMIETSEGSKAFDEGIETSHPYPSCSCVSRRVTQVPDADVSALNSLSYLEG